MTKNEVSYVERIAKRELNTTENYIDNGNKWLYNKTGENTYFALYSTADTNNPTVLYACKGKQAKFEHQFLIEHIGEEDDNGGSIDERAKGIDEILGSYGYDVSGQNVGNGNVVGKGSNIGNANAHIKDTGNKPNVAFLDCLRNIREIQKRSGVVQYADRDTLGNALSKQQVKYFKDSKVRDENGSLKVMYHGTPNAGFTIFRDGTYFTEHKWYADKYQSQSASSLSYKTTANNPDTYAVYLNIKKPFDTRNPEEARIFNEEYLGHYGMGTPLMESGLPDWLDGRDLQDFLEEKGYDYDGLILDEGSVGGYGDEVISRGISYVIFDPAQVKSIDNLNPTENKDMRFSITLFYY